jgi:hypothetical protein
MTMSSDGGMLGDHEPSRERSTASRIQRRERWRVALLLLLTATLLVAPGAADSAFGGTPLSPAARVLLCGLCFAWLTTLFVPVPLLHYRPAAIAIATCVALKIACGLLAASSGWIGRYAYVDQRGNWHAAEFFWRFKIHSYRVDRRLAYDIENFNLNFLNDVERFGYPPYSTTRREIEFPLTVVWTGYVQSDRAARVRVTGSAGGPVAVDVDGRRYSPGDVAALGSGPHRISLTYSKPAGLAPRVDLAVINADNQQPVTVMTDRNRVSASTSLIVLTSVLVMFGCALSLLVLIRSYLRSGFAASFSVGAGAGIVATLVSIIWTAELTVRSAGATVFLHGGGDPLLYASDARDILLHGLLMTRGQPIGHAAPFYFYPFYPYVLATFYALVGDDASTIFFLNGLAVSTLPILFWCLGWRHLGSIAGAAGFVALLAFVGYLCWPIVSFDNPSFTDMVFLAVVFSALVALRVAFKRLTALSLMAAGALIGIGAATRPSFLTLVGVAPIALYATVRAPVSVRLMGGCWLLAGVALGLLPFTLRNVIAAGRFVVLVNSWIQLPYFLIPPEVPEKPGGIPEFAEALRMARDIFLRDPKGTLWVEARKLLFTFGWTRFGPPGVAASPALVILPFTFIGTAGLRRIPPVLLTVLLAFSISHVAAMVLAAPWTFSVKSILPLHAVFLFGSAFLLDRQPSGM